MRVMTLQVIAAAVFSSFIINGCVLPQEKKRDDSGRPLYEAKDYSHLLDMQGFSEALLNDHFKLYQGYVMNSNLLLNRLNTLLLKNKDRTPEYAELKRRLGWEFDGMRLHEYYFGNLGGNGDLDAESALYKKISDDFGSFQLWKRDFISTGMMRGIGWVVLCLDPKVNRLMNIWINEHDTGHMAGTVPLLVMDVFEHAYITDYRLNRAEYIEAFFGNIKWEEVSARFNSALIHTTGSR